MVIHQINLGTGIKEDLIISLGAVRLFEESEHTNSNEITKKILKYSPDRVLLKLRAFQE